MAFTVNAGFSRKLDHYILQGGSRRKHEWKNVQGIVIDLPDNMFGTPECRDFILKHKPEGDGWRLDGFSRTVPKVVQESVVFDLPLEERRRLEQGMDLLGVVIDEAPQDSTN